MVKLVLTSHPWLTSEHFDVAPEALRNFVGSHLIKGESSAIYDIMLKRLKRQTSDNIIQ